MKAIPRTDNNGNYIEDVIVDDDYKKIEAYLVNGEQVGYKVGFKWSGVFYQPRFNIEKYNKNTNIADPSTLWEESLSQEEINKILNPPFDPNAPKTIEQQIALLQTRAESGEAANATLNELLEILISKGVI